jgi:hypothetical protein
MLIERYEGNRLVRYLFELSQLGEHLFSTTFGKKVFKIRSMQNCKRSLSHLPQVAGPIAAVIRSPLCVEAQLR